MQLNSKKESRHKRIEQALRNNLKKRKIFQNKINKESKQQINPLELSSLEIRLQMNSNSIFNKDQLFTVGSLKI